MSSAEAERSAPTSRRGFIGVAVATAASGGAAVACWPLVDQMNPSADMLGGVLIYDLGKVPMGHQVTLLWQRRPLFIRHRTPSEIAAAIAGDGPERRYPQRDIDRVKPGHADWLVLIGVCTYEECMPTFGAGEFGGWMCPCCGSQYDTSGRARKGPARANLVTPEYDFPDLRTIQVVPPMPHIPSRTDVA